MMLMNSERFGRHEADRKFDLDYQDIRRKFNGIARNAGSPGMEETLQQRLVRAQKMEAVGALAGCMVHEFNNILMTIRGYSDLMLTKLDSEDPLARYLVNIDSTCRRAASVVRSILYFARPDVSEKRLKNMNEILLEMEELLHKLLPSGTSLEMQLTENLPLLLLDTGQIKQAIINLILNAKDAMPQGGNIKIRSAIGQTCLPPFSLPQGIRLGRCVEVVLEDSGAGIAPEIRDRIFDPFFTTKGEGKGTGLGLFIVRMVLENHGGAVFVESGHGVGSRFRLFFPPEAINSLPS